MLNVWLTISGTMCLLRQKKNAWWVEYEKVNIFRLSGFISTTLPRNWLRWFGFYFMDEDFFSKLPVIDKPKQGWVKLATACRVLAGWL